VRAGGRTAALVATAAIGPGVAAANPLDAFGFGARGIALGGAATATARDVSANYYNPGGLAASDHLHIDLGYVYTQPFLRLNGADLEVDRSSGFQGGFLLPGDLFGRRVAFSIGVFLPDDRVTRLRALRQSQPRFEVYDNRPQRLVITSSAAVEIVDGLTFGAGVTYLSDTHGALDVEGVVHATDVTHTRLRSRVDVDLEAVRYPSFGLMWRPGRHWRFGLTEREAFSLSLDLDVDVHGRVVTGPQDTTLVDSGRFFLNSVNDNLFSPRQVAFGVAYEHAAFSVSAEVAWLQWSGFPASTATIALELELEPLQVSVPVPDPPLEPGFHDIVVPRLGAELVLADDEVFGFVLRAGGFYEPSPAPAQPGLTNAVDADKIGAATGLGLRFGALHPVRGAVWPGPVTLDVAAQYIRLRERRQRKTDPADGVGDYVADGDIVGTALTLGVLF
jgi:long-subunit fatty acid transport protein